MYEEIRNECKILKNTKNYYMKVFIKQMNSLLRCFLRKSMSMSLFMIPLC